MRTATFRTVRKGYSPDQVHQVLHIAADALAGRIKFHPDHVRTAVFKVVPNGYDQKQVDELLALLEHQLRNGIVPPTGIETGEKLLAVKIPRGANGYDRGEVDAFLARAAANLDGRGKMTANEVRNSRFSTTSGLMNRGYQVRAVDALLDDIEQELRFRGR